MAERLQEVWVGIRMNTEILLFEKKWDEKEKQKPLKTYFFKQLFMKVSANTVCIVCMRERNSVQYL